MNRANEIAEQLMGTCKALSDVATEAECDDAELLRDLDDIVEECQTCNWWCEPSEIVDGECEDCRYSEGWTQMQLPKPDRVRIVIIRNSDGQRRFIHESIFTSRFWWEEGNGACDCNRRHTFNCIPTGEFSWDYADGENECGEGEYSVELPAGMPGDDS